jgi:uncharacterized protein
MDDTIPVLVCYAMPGIQVLRDLTVEKGATLQQAVIQSGILQEFPEVDLQKNRVGIFGKLKSLDAILSENDRVEIYRPLIAEAKEARRKRAAKAR